jgi:OOP family OmpA-OmpF porin
MLKNWLFGLFIGFFVAGGAQADATIPDADIAGSADSEVVGRLAGSFIVDYMTRDFDEMTFPLSALKAVPGETDAHNNTRFRPQSEKTVEGARTRIVYLNAAGSSSLQVMRAYQAELADKGGVELFTCSGEECGGAPNRASSGGGGKMSLGQYLWPEENLTAALYSNAYCTQTSRISDQRYALVHLPEANAFVSIQAFQIDVPSNCKAINAGTVSILDIVQVEQLAAEIVTVKAAEMAAEISDTGKIALYGILFDTDKTEIKPGSQATLAEIAGLLTADPALRLLIVGHTDTVGSYDYNADLSRRRAESVVTALLKDYGIARDRLFPVGVSFASPVASNLTEEGRAKNRRVELVRF